MGVLLVSAGFRYAVRVCSSVYDGGPSLLSESDSWSQDAVSLRAEAIVPATMYVMRFASGERKSGRSSA